MKTREEIETMSDEERCMKTAELCAELCGWSEIKKIGPDGRLGWPYPGMLIGRDPTTKIQKEISDCLNSLDAMHEVWLSLNDHNKVKMAGALMNVLGIHNPLGCTTCIIGAEAKQLNCAFLMVML